MAANDEDARRIQRLKRDSRDGGESVPVGYQNDAAQTRAWSGDDDAPYVKVVNPTSDPVNVSIGGGGTLGVFQVPQDGAADALSVAYEPAVAAFEVAKAAAGRLYQIYVTNEGGGPLFFQIHNTAAAPSAGATPFMTQWRVPNQGALFVDFGEYGLYMSVGITIVSSSTYATYTASAGLAMTALYL